MSTVSVQELDDVCSHHVEFYGRGEKKCLVRRCHGDDDGVQGSGVYCVDYAQDTAADGGVAPCLMVDCLL